MRKLILFNRANDHCGGRCVVDWFGTLGESMEDLESLKSGAEPVSVGEVLALLQTVREQAQDARVLAQTNAQAMIGVVDTIATQWEALANEMEQRVRAAGICADPDGESGDRA